MSGGFVLIVGPSGAGKDTLIGLARQALAEDPGFLFPRRLVTRAPDRWEDHEPVSWLNFESAERAGAFALSWRAHGLGYALPGSTRKAAEDGRIVVCNVSRATLEEARRILPGVTVVEVTAPKEVLARRLEGRSRESAPDVASRLGRTVAPAPRDLVIVNDRSPEEGATLLLAHLRERAGGLRRPALERSA